MILLDPGLISGCAQAAPSARRTNARKTSSSRPPSARTLARFLAVAQKAVKLRGEVSVLLTTDSAVRRLNRTYRGIDRATDVLSFPAADSPAGEERVAGDLAISLPTARRQAAKHGHSALAEIKILILHGLLHLAGFDHHADNGEMYRRERVLRARLGLPHGLIERAVGVSARPQKNRKNPSRSNRSRAAKGRKR